MYSKKGHFYFTKKSMTERKYKLVGNVLPFPIS